MLIEYFPKSKESQNEIAMPPQSGDAILEMLLTNLLAATPALHKMMTTELSWMLMNSKKKLMNP